MNIFPLVSIILPTFNRAHFLNRTISSVFAQDYQNWELIIIDDFSEDNTSSIVSKYLKDKRIIFFKNKTNLGGSGARNVGLKMAKGEYITFIDSDDEYLPTKIKRQVELFQISEISNLGVVNCGRFDKKNGVVYNTWVPKFRGDILKPLLSKDKVGSNTSLLMVKRDVVEKGVFFDEFMPAGQDWDFLVRVCKSFKFDFVKSPLVIIHHHDGPRVYNSTSSIAAYDLQLIKYFDLITSDVFIYKKFLIRKSLVEFVNYRKDKALETLRSYSSGKSIIILFWFFYFRIFDSNEGFFSRVFLKILLFLTFK